MAVKELIVFWSLVNSLSLLLNFSSIFLSVHLFFRHILYLCPSISVSPPVIRPSVWPHVPLSLSKTAQHFCCVHVCVSMTVCFCVYVYGWPYGTFCRDTWRCRYKLILWSRVTKLRLAARPNSTCQFNLIDRCQQTLASVLSVDL